MLFETRNGTKCLPMPGPMKKRENGNDYVLMQMLPAYPQRIEWVREDNLRRVDDEATPNTRS